MGSWRALIIRLLSLPTLAENITMQGIFEKVQEAAAFIKSQWSSTPHAGIILGTGLGSLVDQIEVEAAIDEVNTEYLDLLLDLTGDTYMGVSAIELS